ncbi:hypothetical protein [Vibrio sp.]|uniref:hypothetical protein n=1 Tax=Vibrio sp. TaxID=678 RepID=UPI00311D502F
MYKSKSIFFAAIINFLSSHCMASGISIPGASIPGGYDRVTTIDGITCESTIAESSYIQTGLMGTTQSNDFNSGNFDHRSEKMDGRDEIGAYLQLVIPFGGGKRERLNCNRLYNLEIDRLKAQIEQLKVEATLGDIWAEANDDKPLTQMVTVDERGGSALFGEDNYSLNSLLHISSITSYMLFLMTLTRK